MLTIEITEKELYNEETGTFVNLPGYTITLEHSLVSLSKWESFYEKPFLSSTEKTEEELGNYIRAMVVDQTFPSDFVERLTIDNIKQIHSYIESKQSATTFGKSIDEPKRREIITAELIYYWMVAFNIPFECQFWHLNKLFALIRVCSIKSNSEKAKTPTPSQMHARRELNEARKRALGTSG